MPNFVAFLEYFCTVATLIKKSSSVTETKSDAILFRSEVNSARHSEKDEPIRFHKKHYPLARYALRIDICVCIKAKKVKKLKTSGYSCSFTRVKLLPYAFTKHVRKVTLSLLLTSHINLRERTYQSSVEIRNTKKKIRKVDPFITDD